LINQRAYRPFHTNPEDHAMFDRTMNDSRHLTLAVAALAVSIVLAFGTLAHAVTAMVPSL
jgi:hypothetical protein